MWKQLNTRTCCLCKLRLPTKNGAVIGKREFYCEKCKTAAPVSAKPASQNRGSSYANTKARRLLIKEEARAAAARKKMLEAEKILNDREFEDRKFQGKLDEAMQILQSDDFRLWHLATTGREPDDFIREATNSPFIKNGAHGSGWRHQLLDRIEIRIEQLVLYNKWTNPDTKALIAESLFGVRDAQKRRMIMQRLATPVWASVEKIKLIYAERDRLVAETGIPHDVDHVIPIVNKLVCGLHCETNLAILPASENRRKSNKFFIE